MRFPRATHLVILVDGFPKWRWLLGAVYKRLIQELDKLKVKVNIDKTKTVDLAQGETFSFLGFTYRRKRTQKGKWGVTITPRIKVGTALLKKIKEIFRRYKSKTSNNTLNKTYSEGMGKLF